MITLFFAAVTFAFFASVVAAAAFDIAAARVKLA
jgi:hypothetical protein